jgi:hypothetical protein
VNDEMQLIRFERCEDCEIVGLNVIRRGNSKEQFRSCKAFLSAATETMLVIEQLIDLKNRDLVVEIQIRKW